MARVGDQWRVELSVIANDGRLVGARQFESSGSDCAALAEAVTLAVVLTIDPQAAFQRVPADTPPALSPPALSPPALLPPAPAPTEATASPPRGATTATEYPVARANQPTAAALSGTMRGLFVVGLLPRASWGVESSVELALSSKIRLSTAVGFLPEVRTADGDYGFALSEAAAGVCFVASDNLPTRVELCGEALLGSIRAGVYSVQSLPPGEHVLIASRFGPRLGLRLGGPVSLELGALLLVPFIRHRFVLRGASGTVFQSKAIGLNASAGVSVSIP